MESNPVNKFAKIKAEAQSFFDDRALALREGKAGQWWRRLIHFWVVVTRNFSRNRCPVRAASLAFTTILALVPVLAVVLSVCTSLIKDQSEVLVRQLIDRVVLYVAPQSNLMAQVNDTGEQTRGREELVQRITEYINNIQTGRLGVTGVISLILVAILLLSNIESTFNDIWGVERGRSWFSRVVNYWAAITLGPIIIFSSQGLTATAQVEATTRWLGSLPVIGQWIIAFIPLVILVPGFALFYMFMPNTRVTWTAALVGALFSGTLWQLNNVFSVIYLSKVVTYSKIYGSFGILPLFLLGLYYSWLILLLGAQVAYAYQYRRAYVEQAVAESVSQSGREFVALRVMTFLAKAFHLGEKPPTLIQISNVLGAPSRLLMQILQVLVKARLLVEVMGIETGYTPARSLHQISYREIIEAMRTSQGHELETREEADRALVRQEFNRIRQTEQQAAEAVSLQGIIDQLSEQSAAPSSG